MYQSGLVFGSLLMLLSVLATVVSIDMLTDASDHYRCRTYEDLVERALGKRGRQLTELSIVVSCVGILVAYLIAVGDILEPFVGTEHRALSLILCWATTAMPLSLLRTVDSLKWASSTGMISIGLLVIAAMHHVQLDVESHQTYALADMLWPADGARSVLVACPIVLFAFNCQANVSSIYEELPRKESMRGVTRTSMSFCAVIYLVMGLIGMWDFGPSVLPNILANYHNPKYVYLQIAFASMAIALIMAFPLNVFPARTTIFGLLNSSNNVSDDLMTDLQEPLLDESGDSPKDDEHVDSGRLLTNTTVDLESGTQDASSDSGDGSSVSSLPSVLPPPEAGLCSHVWVSFLVAGSSLGFALVVPNISVVFGLLGGTMGSLIGFVLPGMCGVAMGRPAGWLLIVPGTVVGVLTTAVTVYSSF